MYFSKVFKVIITLSLLALVFPLSMVHGQVPIGTAVVRDSSPGLSDQLVVNLSNVPALSDSEAYEGWLVSDDGSTELSIGLLVVSSTGSVSHTYSSPSGENLAAGYDTFAISIESVPDANAASSGKTAFSDTIATEGMTHIRKLLNSESGSTVGMITQATVAVTHAENGVNGKTLSEIHDHAAHVINIIEGSAGANFDATHSNPGDGVGVLTYASNAKTEAGAAQAAAPANTLIAANGQQVTTLAGNVESWAKLARDHAVTAKSSDSISTARAFITNAHVLMGRALNGWDADRDGTTEAISGEGGATQAQEEAQNMATFNPAPHVELPATGDMSFTVFALIALSAGAVLLTSGGFLFRRSRTTS
jgi:LPXTG-motif cell wall-anchored protein